MNRDQAIELLARAICLAVSIAPVDLDGSQNWWMFRSDAEKLVNDLEKRGFFKRRGG